MKVHLAIPWRPTEDRLESFKVTLERVRRYYDYDALYTVDSGHTNFNRAASRNLAVEVAQEAGADIVVLNDADSVPEHNTTVVEAIEAAYADGLMHFPFSEVWYIDYKGLVRVQQGHGQHQIQSRIWDKCESEGGIWICKPETWWKAGGQDPRLNGWGCDDRSFLAASRTLVGPPQKHDGVLFCLPHYRPTGEEIWIPEEVQLLIEYQSAYLQPEEMQRIIYSRPVEEKPRPVVTTLK